MAQNYDRSTFYGIDTQSTRDNARSMNQSADDLGSMVSGISQLLDSTLWLGPGAQRFKGDWEGSMKPQMQDASRSLQENAAEMNRRADMQDAASS